MPCRERCTIEGELSENGVETGAHIACSPACEKVIAERDAERMMVAGPTQSRAVVSVAVMVAATVADEAARAAGE